MVYNWDFKYKELIIEMYKDVFEDVKSEDFETSVKFVTKETIAKTIVTIDEFRKEGFNICQSVQKTKEYLKLIYKNEIADLAAPLRWQ